MMKNKIIAMLLATVLLLSLVVVPAPVKAANEYTVRLADANGNGVVTAKAGDTVTLALSIENNPGVIGVGVELTYPQQLSVTKAELNAMDMMTMYTQYKFMPNITCSETLATNPYLVWMNQATGTTEKKLVTYNGNFYEVSFKVAEDAQPGDYTITLAAPSDKNTTASVDGDGVIQPDTNTPVTNIALVNCTIRVESDECAHSWGEWTDVPGEEATCEDGGRQVRICSLCEEPEYRDSDPTNHSFTTYTETTSATCITNSKETATCDNGCGETDEKEVANSATGVHSFQGQPYIPNDDATCLADGTHYRVCSVDGCDAKEEATRDEGSQLSHSYTGTALTHPATEANCHAAATYYHTCVNGCGGHGTTTFSHGSVNANNHDGETALRNAEPATEEAPGYTGDLWCLGCNTMIQQGRPIDQLDHTHNMNKTAANGKTCTQPGNIEYYTCTKCNKLYNDEAGTTELQLADTVIPASHELTKTQAQPNSCTEPGNIEYHTCSVCTKKFSDAAGTNEVTNTVIPAAGHNMNKTAAQPNSCTEPGNIEYYTCETCNKLYLDEQGNTETSATAVYRAPHGHNMRKTNAQTAGCTEPGNIEYYTCQTCNKLYLDEQGAQQIQQADTVIPAAHKLDKTEKDPATCTEPGNIEYYTCSACQKIYSDAEATNEITAADTVEAALGHKIDKVLAKPAGCTEQGNVEHYACSNGCGEHYEDAEGVALMEVSKVYLPALGHDLVEHKAVDATVEAEGSILHYECKTCNQLLAADKKTVIEEKDTVIPKLPKPESATPSAGDNFDVSLCIAVMLLACLCLALTVVIRKKATR